MKTLVLLRHAHRDTSDREADNGLSEKGCKQTERLLSYYLRKIPQDQAAQALFLSSPKLRCRQTLEPLAKAAGRPMRISPLLDEQGPAESETELLSRVRQFLAWWREDGPELVFASSHGDWLPLALEALTGQAEALSKGAWAMLQMKKGAADRVALLELVQDPR